MKTSEVVKWFLTSSNLDEWPLSERAHYKFAWTIAGGYWGDIYSLTEEEKQALIDDPWEEDT